LNCPDCSCRISPKEYIKILSIESLEIDKIDLEAFKPEKNFQIIHDHPDCKLKDSFKLACGHIICRGCLCNYLFDKTDRFIDPEMQIDPNCFKNWNGKSFQSCGNFLKTNFDLNSV
jgi:hypothetical protein